MLFKRLNREGAENVFRTVYNVEGATMTTGRAASLINTSTDGVNAVIANAAGDYVGFIGFATKDIANNDYGLVQVNGLVNSILLSNAGTSITVTANDCLIPAPAGAYSAAAPTYANAGFINVHALDTATVSAVAYVRGLIINMG